MTPTAILEPTLAIVPPQAEAVAYRDALEARERELLLELRVRELERQVAGWMLLAVTALALAGLLGLALLVAV